MNNSTYKFTDKVPVVTISGYFPKGGNGTDKDLLTFQTINAQGICAFGAVGGVITEDDLTDELVEEFFMKRLDAPEAVGVEGKPLYADLFVKKDGSDAKNENKKSKN